MQVMSCKYNGMQANIRKINPPALFIACCSLLAVHCLLFTACCSLLAVHCLLFTAYCSLLTVHCLLFTAYCSLLAVHCLLFTACCSLFAVHCLLFTACCSHSLYLADHCAVNCRQMAVTFFDFVQPPYVFLTTYKSKASSRKRTETTRPVGLQQEE